MWVTNEHLELERGQYVGKVRNKESKRSTQADEANRVRNCRWKKKGWRVGRGEKQRGRCNITGFQPKKTEGGISLIRGDRG
jgi:hypothetical protein